MTKAAALACGLWQRGNGFYVPVRSMPDGHLINALLQALAAGEARNVTQPLAREVARRGLQAQALAVAGEREQHSRR